MKITIIKKAIHPENGNVIRLIQDDNLNYGIEEIDKEGLSYITWDADFPEGFSELAEIIENNRE